LAVDTPLIMEMMLKKQKLFIDDDCMEGYVNFKEESLMTMEKV
jgi:hypothetical protein